MPRINNVTLEILRHGPPHNQLLSPLTEYLALCGNHGSVTVRVPYEHTHFLARHRDLTYGEKGSPKQREMTLKITAQEIGEVLAGVPGLIAELSKPRGDDELTHFEVVLSCSELALLPFELADAPNGFPGAGQSLTLQTQAPLCMTRRVRRVDNAFFKWPTHPRILCAVASPPGLRPVPVRSHLAALRKVLDPWLLRSVGEERFTSLSGELARHLTVLPQASARQISEKIKEGGYTHVHILAHGVEYDEGYDQRFGLALHDDRDPAREDRVSASRLATAVRPFKSRDSGLADPAVVTVASCYGAGQGSVVGAGSSVAHALHEAGVPLVVSSQFPLSFAGSVVMVERLYQDLLWGKDPRTLINDLRRQLKTQIPKTHDWASLVAYAALPAEIERQLADLCFRQAKRAIEAAFYFVESDRELWKPRRRRDDPPTVDKKSYQDFLERLTHAKIKLEELVTQDDAHRREGGHPLLRPASSSEVRGLLASTAKREAEVHWRHEELEQRKLWGDALREARVWYGKAFETDRTQVWALAQEIALASVLAIRLGSDPESWKERLRHRWWAAYGLLHRDLDGSDRQQHIWAHSNLIEIHMVWLLICPESDPPFGDAFDREVEKAMQQVLDHTADLLALVSEGDLEIRSRQRQSERYVIFFLKAARTGAEGDIKIEGPEHLPLKRVGELAWKVLDRLRELSGTVGDAPQSPSPGSAD